MPFMMQGWTTRPDGTPIVAALVISKAATWEAWELYKGEYDPAKGQTINDVVWNFYCAGNLMSIVTIDLTSEVLRWQDKQQGADLLAALRAVKDACLGVSASVASSGAGPTSSR